MWIEFRKRLRMSTLSRGHINLGNSTSLKYLIRKREKCRALGICVEWSLLLLLVRLGAANWTLETKTSLFEHKDFLFTLHWSKRGYGDSPLILSVVTLFASTWCASELCYVLIPVPISPRAHVGRILFDVIVVVGGFLWLWNSTIRVGPKEFTKRSRFVLVFHFYF